MALPLSKAKLSALRKFLLKKTREAEGRFFIEGWHLLDEALKSGRPLRALVFDHDSRREAEEEGVLQRAMAAAEECFTASAPQLEQLSDTPSAQGVVALIDRVGRPYEDLRESWQGREGPLRLLALDAVADPGNCGAIIRACGWFGLDGALLGRGCAELENGKTTRATMGGLFHLPVATGVDLESALKDLRSQGCSALSAELNGAVSLSGFRFPERCILVVGNEARGVSPAVSALADARVFAPRFGSGESLNAAMAAAVFLTRWRL